jgi:hypothetical protein
MNNCPHLEGCRRRIAEERVEAQQTYPTQGPVQDDRFSRQRQAQNQPAANQNRNAVAQFGSLEDDYGSVYGR